MKGGENAIKGQFSWSVYLEVMLVGSNLHFVMELFSIEDGY
jgi:hypothetical protein